MSKICGTSENKQCITIFHCLKLYGPDDMFGQSNRFVGVYQCYKCVSHLHDKTGDREIQIAYMYI